MKCIQRRPSCGLLNLLEKRFLPYRYRHLKIQNFLLLCRTLRWQSRCLYVIRRKSESVIFIESETFSRNITTNRKLIRNFVRISVFSVAFISDTFSSMFRFVFFCRMLKKGHRLAGGKLIPFILWIKAVSIVSPKQ